MSPETFIYLAAAVWLLIAAVVIGYPLRTGIIRVGRNPVSRDSTPGDFWRAYVISTALFLAVSIALGLFVRSILRQP
jgi:hypothetical protein